MFEVNGDKLELRFNTQKIKTLEAMHGFSLMSELSKNRGMLSLHLAEGLFTVGLYNMTTEQNVKGKKATDIFTKLMESEGFAEINAAIIGKLENDMGFLFQ